MDVRHWSAGTQTLFYDKKCMCWLVILTFNYFFDMYSESADFSLLDSLVKIFDISARFCVYVIY